MVARPENRLRARNTPAKRRFGAVACDICPVVLFHSGGSQISGADMIGRPCNLGRVALVFAPPESTSRGEKTRTAAEKSDERPLQLVHLSYSFGGIDHPEKELATRNSPTKCRFGEPPPLSARWHFSSWSDANQWRRNNWATLRSAESPVLFPDRHRPLGRTKATSAKKFGEALRRKRRRCVGPRRTSPSRRNKTNERASSQRSRLFFGLALVIFPAELTTHVDRNTRGPKICTKRHFGIVA